MPCCYFCGETLEEYEMITVQGKLRYRRVPQCKAIPKAHDERKLSEAKGE